MAGCNIIFSEFEKTNETAPLAADGTLNAVALNVAPVTITWSNQEIETPFVDCNLQIKVNGIVKVDSFTNQSGSFQVNPGDVVSCQAYAISSFPSGNSYIQLDVNYAESKIRDTVGSLITTITARSQDINIAAKAIHSDTEFTAIRSGLFIKTCLGGVGYQVAYTKTYTSAISQSEADDAASSDANFNAEGQDNAEYDGVCGIAYSLDGSTYQSNGVFNSLSPGSYTLYVTSGNGCTEDRNFSILPFGTKTYNKPSGKLLGVTIDNEFIECETSCEFNWNVDMKAASSVTSGRWREFIAGYREWSVTVNALLLLQASGANFKTILNAVITGKEIKLEFRTRLWVVPELIITGDVLAASGGISAPNTGKTNWNVTFKGTGPFEVIGDDFWDIINAQPPTMDWQTIVDQTNTW